jgi:hypothetical protein
VDEIAERPVANDIQSPSNNVPQTTRQSGWLTRANIQIIPNPTEKLSFNTE